MSDNNGMYLLCFYKFEPSKVAKIRASKEGATFISENIVLDKDMHKNISFPITRFSISGHVVNSIGMGPGYLKVDIIDENDMVIATKEFRGCHMQATTYKFTNIKTFSSKIKLHFETSDEQYTTDLYKVQKDMNIDVRFPE